MVVPTAVLATAVVVGVSRSGQGAAATSDGDLQRDLTLASATNLELAPAGQPLATVSPIEASSATAERTVRPRRRSTGSRASRSRPAVVRPAPRPEVVEAVEEPETSAAAELAGTADAGMEASVAGGVALPRPTAIPVIIPTGGGGDIYDPGPGSVIRGGVLDGDHCQIHGRGRPVYGPPIYRQPRGLTISDRVRVSQPPRERTPSIADRVRRSEASGSTRGSSIGDRVRRSQGRSSSGSSRSPLAGRIRGR